MAISTANIRMEAYDNSLRLQYGPMLCGVDECGRGAYAGPIAAGAVILPSNAKLPGLNDSKAMTAPRRKELSEMVKDIALVWRVEFISAEEIDTNGLTWANQTVMYRAAKWCAEKIAENVDLYIVDQSPSFSLRPHIMMSKADGTSLSVAAAAVVAKVTRDALMHDLAEKHPQYDWGTRHGYVSDAHVEAVRKHGMVDGIHRKSYKIKALATEKQLTLEDLL